MSFYFNSEGYCDPTAGAALSNIIRKERSDRRKARRKQNAVVKKSAVSKNVETDEKDKTRPVPGTR